MNNQPGSAAGNGIYSDQGAVGVVIAANRFERHENSGILFAGGTVTPNSDRSILIKNNFSLNENSFVAFFSTVNSIIRDNRSNDTVNADDFGSTIFVGGDSAGILIDANVLNNPGFSGIAVRDVLGAVGASNVDVINNQVTNAEGDGIYFGPDTKGNVIRANRALDNDVFDCEDDSIGAGTGGTANFRNNNVGRTDDPPQLCRNP